MAERGPDVVALGGGHGLAAALRAIRSYAGTITAVVSVADDGGSSGRLRRDLGVPAPGDVRRCLAALADDPTWAAAFEHRFSGGDLDGHALGNVVIAGLADTLGSFTAAVDEAGRLLRTVGRVLPATTEPVVLKAKGLHGDVEGQVAVHNSRGIRALEIVPEDAPAHPDALAALAHADQVVLAPGSLYTSIMPVLLVPTLRAAIAATPGRVVQVANLRPQPAETVGLDGNDHLAAVLDLGTRVDVFLYPRDGELAVDPRQVEARGVVPRAEWVTEGARPVHDAGRLAKALSALL